jgi:hypothetical protein
MVPDEDAKAFDETLTAVKISYTLTDEELCRAYLRVGMTRTNRLLLGGISVLSFAAAAFYVVWFCLHLSGASLAFAVLFAALGVVTAVFPRLSIRRYAKKNNDHQKYILKIYPDVIEGEHGGSKITIPLDGSFTRVHEKGLFLLYSTKGPIDRDHLLVLPLRSVEPDVLADVEAMLRVGTCRSKGKSVR